MRKAKKVRYAVVGLGWIAQAAVLPAFRHVPNARLAALVSNDPKKRAELAERHDVELTCGYDDYDALLESGDVDAVYIALPNDLHADYAVRAARAGVHVLCEKPLAVTERDCEAMIRACRQNDVKLMTAYRLHLEEGTLTTLEQVRRGAIGDVRSFHAEHTRDVKAGDIRLQRDRGGGSLYDLGIYGINAARLLFGDEPDEVFAFTASRDDRRFAEVDEMTHAVMRFPGERLATVISSVGAAARSTWTVVGTKGALTMDPAFVFDADLRSVRTDAEGQRKEERRYAARDQFGALLLYFSRCILEDREPEPNGEEGLADVRVVRALYRSADEGRPIRLTPIRRDRTPGADQDIHVPPLEGVGDYVRAKGPGK